ncbi:hypothetical protein EW146_g3226 [Bondarzewia mesenterica]|uniref:C2 domain-containing protein n=1 Tax=Bondarzewia mesenterica TaxID=1095465 RepID=A0A4S4LYN8_9AGAM|nr:hypothetical protein EW146_g3226 [Bondarzewia mesenterica]
MSSGSVSREIGTLIAVILKARNLPNKRHIGKQDPYCAVALNGEKRRTKAIKRGGQHPEWDEEIRFTIYEDVEDELVQSADSTPPPPPPKNGRSTKKIKGSKSMAIACFADDPREPDLIGEATVDLTEVLTKGETDVHAEWFTLSNKDKYCGEVYLELTFWSNERPPEKKTTPKPSKIGKQYGGPGSFIPAGDASGQSRPSRSSSLSGSVISEEPRWDSLPTSLRPSTSQAHIDLYVPPYEQTVRGRPPYISPAEQMASEFGALGISEPRGKRESYPPIQNGHVTRPASVGYSLSSTPSPNHQGSEPGSWSEGTAHIHDRPETPQGQRYHLNSSSSSQSYTSQLSYQAPYEPSHRAPSLSHSPHQHRGPRYSIPTTSTGFTPVSSTSEPSGFASLPFPSHMSESSGLAPLSGATPAPASGYASAPLYPSMSSKYTPISTQDAMPSAYMSPMSPMPSSSTFQQSQPGPSHQPAYTNYQGYAPSSPASSLPASAAPGQYLPPLPNPAFPVPMHSHSAPPPSHQGYSPPTPLPHEHQQPSIPGVSQPPGSRPLPQQPHGYGQPQLSIVNQKGYGQLPTHSQPQYGQTPQPSSSHGQFSSPVHGHGLPAGQQHTLLPTPPGLPGPLPNSPGPSVPLPAPPGPPGSLYPGSYSPPQPGSNGFAPSQSYNHIPPPPPLPSQPSQLSSMSSNHSYIPPASPNPTSLSPSACTPPSQGHIRAVSGRQSLPLPQPPQSAQQQPVFKPIPPPPLPPSLSLGSNFQYQTQLPPPSSLGNQSHGFYPGPPPRPPAQITASLPQSQWLPLPGEMQVYRQQGSH